VSSGQSVVDELGRIVDEPGTRPGFRGGTPPEYWLNLQHMHDLAAAREELADALARIRPLVA
jgi:hypothetical protein